MIVRLAVIILLLGASPIRGEESTLEERGRTLAERMCAQCHAIGRTGASPHVGAPAFRALNRPRVRPVSEVDSGAVSQC